MRTCSKHGVGSSDYSLGWTYRIGQKTTEIPEEFGEKRYTIPFFSKMGKGSRFNPKNPILFYKNIENYEEIIHRIFEHIQIVYKA